MIRRPITALELREEEVRESAILGVLERALGEALRPQFRHYLADQPVHCGDRLELYRDANGFRVGTNGPSSPPFTPHSRTIGASSNSMARACSVGPSPSRPRPE